MIIHDVEQKSLEWLALRRDKITGTSLKSIIGTAKSRESAFYEHLAARLTDGSNDDENALERGERLESEAIAQFEKITGKIVEHVGLCVKDDCPYIASSPDGLIKTVDKYGEAVEVKCLSSAKYVRAWIENEIPEEYRPQCVQYFIVNEDLETLYFVLYDPRVSIHPIHIIELHRADIEHDIEHYEKMQKQFLKDIDDKLDELLEI